MNRNDPINTTAILTELYRIYDRLNKDWWHDELPQVFITLNPGTQGKKQYYGMFTPKSWGHTNITEEEKAQNPNGDAFINPDRILDYSHEISISPEFFLRPLENWVGTLQHEVVHLYCEINNILDTSNNGVYHNKRFLNVAEEHGLRADKAETVGYAYTIPSDQFAFWCKSLEVDEKLFQYFRKIAEKSETKATPKKRYVCPTCGMTVQAKRNLNIVCGACNKQLDYWDLTIEGEEDILQDYNDGLALSVKGWFGARQIKEQEDEIQVVKPKSSSHKVPDTDTDPNVDNDEEDDGEDEIYDD